VEEFLKTVQSWMQQNPQVSASTTRFVAAISAIGGIVLWWYSVKKSRREERAARREQLVGEYYRKLENKEKEMQKGACSSVTMIDPKAEAGEDSDVLAEAWRRYQRDKAGRASGKSAWPPKFP
jgi:hypothetical protein